MSDAMHEFSRNVRFAFRQIWTWYETYIIIICFLIVMSVIVGGSAKQALIEQHEKQIEVIKFQNKNSIEDRDYLHKELENTRKELKSTRDSLRRLEFKVRSEEAGQ